MAIVKCQPREVLDLARCQLGLPQSESVADDVYIAAVLRHCAGFLCPCSGTTLKTTVRESLHYLIDNGGLDEQIDTAIENLTVGGDLLELNHVTTNDAAAKGTWIFAAPPGYVVRKTGSIFLTGVVEDQDTYLPKTLSERIRYKDCTRILVPESYEDLIGELAELGLQKISQDSWLKCPRAQSATEFLSGLKRRLLSGSRSGDIPDIQILDSARSITYYRGRWVAPKRHSGVFVARRPQQYGAPIWCFVELENGGPQRILDFPLPKERWRGCDTAWYLQSAIDYVRGTPQRYRRRNAPEGAYLDFFSPLPLWTQRRLVIVGRKANAEKCLLSFWIPASELEEEERFLQKRLWLSRIDGKGGVHNHADNT